jgi:serine/threonine protein phosphatase PrpC
VGGIRQERSDLITAVEPASPFGAEARKGRLYVVVEAEEGAPRSAAACQLVARTVRRAFYEDETYSVTSALRNAIRAANKALYEQNFKQPAGQRAQVGITCAVLRDADLYVAQVQPAQAYVLGEGRLRALPAHPSWDPAHLSAAPFSRTGGLGASLFVEPELYRCVLRPGDGALLCSSNLAHALARPDVDALLRQGDAPAAAEQLAAVAARAAVADAHALVVAVVPALSKAAREAPLSPAGVSERSRLAARTVGGWIGGITGGSLLARRKTPAAPAAPRPDPLHTLPEEPAYSPAPPARPAPLDVGETLGERYERKRREQPDTAPLRRENLPPSAFIGEEPYPAGGPRRVDLGAEPLADPRPYRPRYEIRPLVDLTWGERLAMPFQKLAGAVEDSVRARRGRRPPPPPRPISRGQGLSYRRTKPPFPWPLLLGLVLVVAALVFYGLTLSRQNDQDLALEYFAAADQRLAAVRDAADEPAALESLDLARQAIDEVRGSPNVTDTNPPLWLRYQELQREYERALAAVQRLTFFDDPTVLAVHPSPTGRFTSIVVPPALTNITDTNVLEGLRYVYAVDSDAQSARLYRIPRNGGAPEAYLSPGQSVGTAVVGPVRSALWRIDQVVAIDQAPSGFGYYFRNGGSWNYSKLGASEIWTPRDRLDVEGYDGNLYVWGAQPGELLRFRSGFYGDTPDFWLDKGALADTDLSTVVDMAVDGSVYLLRADGSVLIFSLGRPVGEVKPEAITPPLTIVKGFYVTGTTPETGYFFIVDSLNERIIQMEKGTGKVIQQIKVRPESPVQLKELAALYVDDTGARPILYLANAGELIRVELPAPPRPFRESQGGTPGPTAAPTAAP